MFPTAIHIFQGFPAVAYCVNFESSLLSATGIAVADNSDSFEFDLITNLAKMRRKQIVLFASCQVQEKNTFAISDIWFIFNLE